MAITQLEFLSRQKEPAQPQSGLFITGTEAQSALNAHLMRMDHRYWVDEDSGQRDSTDTIVFKVGYREARKPPQYSRWQVTKRGEDKFSIEKT